MIIKIEKVLHSVFMAAIAIMITCSIVTILCFKQVRKIKMGVYWNFFMFSPIFVSFYHRQRKESFCRFFCTSPPTFSLLFLHCHHPILQAGWKESFLGCCAPPPYFFIVTIICFLLHQSIASNTRVLRLQTIPSTL